MLRRSNSSACSGHPGAEKSTALRIIAGLGEFSGGTVHWPTAQYDAAGAKPQRELGFVFQEPTLMPWASVFENVYLPFLLEGPLRAAQTKDRVESALELVGLAGFAKAYPRELSGGMKMRVSIARADRRSRSCCCSTNRSRRWTRSPA